MPFRLKSAEVTYHRDIQWCLHSQLGCNTVAYIDDVVVKIREDKGLISDLAETFDNLRKFKMKLNLHIRCVLRKITQVYGLPSWD
jgi:hypothetical protein